MKPKFKVGDEVIRQESVVRYRMTITNIRNVIVRGENLCRYRCETDTGLYGYYYEDQLIESSKILY